MTPFTDRKDEERSKYRHVCGVCCVCENVNVFVFNLVRSLYGLKLKLGIMGQKKTFKIQQSRTEQGSKIEQTLLCQPEVNKPPWSLIITNLQYRKSFHHGRKSLFKTTVFALLHDLSKTFATVL